MSRGDQETQGNLTPILSMSQESCHNKEVEVLVLQPEAQLVPNLEDLVEPSLPLQEEGPQRPGGSHLQEEGQEAAVGGDRGLVQEEAGEAQSEEDQSEVETHKTEQVT